MSPDVRRALLEEALGKQGLVIRPDSSLCRSYIQGTLSSEYTPDTIAYMCGIHKWLYEYTSYPYKCAVLLPASAHHMSASMGSYTAALSYVKQHEAPLIKAAVLEEYGVPDNWPWLQSSAVVAESIMTK